MRPLSSGLSIVIPAKAGVTGLVLEVSKLSLQFLP